jgi:hypothetical protein
MMRTIFISTLAIVTLHTACHLHAEPVEHQSVSYYHSSSNNTAPDGSDIPLDPTSVAKPEYPRQLPQPPARPNGYQPPAAAAQPSPALAHQAESLDDETLDKIRTHARAIARSRIEARAQAKASEGRNVSIAQQVKSTDTAEADRQEEPTGCTESENSYDACDEWDELRTK